MVYANRVISSICSNWDKSSASIQVIFTVTALKFAKLSGSRLKGIRGALSLLGQYRRSAVSGFSHPVNFWLHMSNFY